MFTRPGFTSVVLLLAGVVGVLVLLARLGRVPLLYNLRNLFVRWRTSFSTTLAFTGVIALFIIMLAFVQGFMSMTTGSGHPANIMVLSRGATDELVSTIEAKDARSDIALQPGIVHDAEDRPLCSREVYVVVNQLLPESSDRDTEPPSRLDRLCRIVSRVFGEPPASETKRRLIQVRGVEDAGIAAAVHGMSTLSAGAWFSSAGVRTLPASESNGSSVYAIEAVIGASIARQWHLSVGDRFEVGPRTWVVAGILPAGGSTFDSEVWAKHQQVAQIFGKEHSFTSLLLRTKDAGAARTVAEDLNQHFKQASFHVLPETEYYATLAKTNEGFEIAVCVVAVIIAVGGVLGVMNTMFASVAQRRKDIAMLRILGFARWQVLVSFLVEALLLSLVGGTLGCVIGSMGARVDGQQPDRQPEHGVHAERGRVDALGGDRVHAGDGRGGRAAAGAVHHAGSTAGGAAGGVRKATQTMSWKLLALIALLIVLGWVSSMTLLSLLSSRPANLGVLDGKLAPCPATPNCVCSQAGDDHAIQPLRFEGDPDEAWQRLRQVLAARPRTRIVREEDDYLRVECTSLMFRFTDDVEFLLDREAGVIHFRSASRIGKSDLGVNRKRMEEIRQAFAAPKDS